MKDLVKIFGVLIILVFMACQKEELSLTEVNTVSHETGKSLNAIIGLKIIKKTLKPTQSTLGVGLETRTEHSSLVFDDKMWILAGASNSAPVTNDVLYSDTGVSWQASPEAPFIARRGHASTVFDAKMWVVGGRTWDHKGGNINTSLNDVWSSSDGIVWEEVTANAPFSPRSGHTLTAFDGALWVIGEDVWRSSDGETWVLVTADAPFGMRWGHAAIVRKEKLWVVAGTQIGVQVENGISNVNRNDVWYTNDGYEWIQATEDAAFSARFGHGLTTDGTWMWLTAGMADEYNNDIWFSNNGQKWIQAPTCWSFSARSMHSSVFFDDNLFIINGSSTDGLLSNMKFFEEVKYCITKIKDPPVVQDRTTRSIRGK